MIVISAVGNRAYRSGALGDSVGVLCKRAYRLDLAAILPARLETAPTEVGLLETP